MLYRSGGQPEVKWYQDCKIATQPGTRKVVARISSTSVDRDGDVLLPSGLDLKDFRHNPVLLWSHNGDQLPIGKVPHIEPRHDDVVATVIFADRPKSLPKTSEWPADTIHDLFQQGVLKAFSVGFSVPIGGFRMAEKRDQARFGEGVRRVITRWKLAELSVVSVPANQDAVALAVSKGRLRPDSCVIAEMLSMDASLEYLITENPPLSFDTEPTTPLSFD